MEASDGSPPPSLCMVRAAELFPKPQMEKEDIELKVPFQELAGESVKYLGRTDDGILALSNYRIFLQKSSTNVETSIPLGLIESAQSRDLFHLIICCKDASTVKCSFETAEQCTEWQRRIQMSVGVPETLESIFAFPFCSWACDTLNGGAGGGSQTFSSINNSNIENGPNPSAVYSVLDYAERLQKSGSRYEEDFMREVERLGFDLNGSWRISHANEDFKLCPSYPPKLLVPCCISDDTLNNVANFRGSRRLPAVVWRHRKSGAVIARCSQPEVGWLGWRNTNDEQLLKALADACAFDRGEQMRQFANTSQSAQSIQIPSGDSSPSSPDGSHEEVPLDEVRKILIVDARSYTSAVTNRARGGGCECIEYYPCAEIEFMNLGNIHVIRKSFHALRQLCASPPDVPNWLGLLEKTMWLQHISGLLAASMTVCHAIEKKGRPVLVHCSDGWDRTPQIVATAQLCLDPYYRTVEGFRVLVEREWLSYGHKFADRCGHGPGSEELNERCPVFLQWLDLVHQIHKQFSCSFEFSMGYLIKLAQHSHSGLFGNFLCNTLKERLENSVFERTFSVWSFLSSPMYRNPLYKPQRYKVLWPAHNVRDLSLWTEVYLGSLGGNQNAIDFPNYINDTPMGSISSMSKTRSYGDLITAGFIPNSMSRRSSDPNMTVDPNLTIGSNSENNSIADLQSDDREESPDILANLIHDTTRKLENLTNELDKDDFQLATKHNSTSILESALGNDSHSLIENGMTNNATTGMAPSTNGIGGITHQNSNEQIGCDYDSSSMQILRPSSPISKVSIAESSKLISENLHVEQEKEEKLRRDVTDSATNGFNGIELSSNGITIEKHSNLGLDVMMKSVALDDTCLNGLETQCNGSALMTNSKTDDSLNLWHGSVNTSTDTLVPMTETKIQNGSCDLTDGGNGGSGGTSDASLSKSLQDSHTTAAVSNAQASNTMEKMKISTNFNNILPKVHSTTNNNVALQAPSLPPSRPNQLSTTSSDNSPKLLTQITAAAASSGSTSTNGSENISLITSQTECESEVMGMATDCDGRGGGMEESILILPAHRKLEIFISGKCETIAANTTTSSAMSSMLPQSQWQSHGSLATANSTSSTVVTAQCGGGDVGSSAAATPTSSMSNFILPYANSNTIATTTTNTIIPNTTTAASSQRRRRTSSTHSGFVARQQVNGGSNTSRFSLPGGGVRSLPMTPPGLTERQQVTNSCPDGLAHALSEENIRLQQIVHEHKMLEDALRRELHEMRMALLKKSCPNCNNANASANTDEQRMLYDNTSNLPPYHRRYYARSLPSSYRKCPKHYRKRNNSGLRRYYSSSHDTNTEDDEVADLYDESGSDDDDNDNGYDYDDNDMYSVSGCSALDNVENASICSWEAVEDRSTSGPSSCTTTSSSMQPNATSVLWVPDHAVSRCTSCQTEFWLGRRKHHCRSCGQIFCADCSEFWAALPDAKLFSPVRLCGPCYTVTTRSIQQQQQINHDMQHNIVGSNSSSLHLQQNSAVAVAVAAAAKPAATSKA
uniref:Lateral signaling target protein 2 homolog n=1 Tax=Stomoxys calcitrans TaxID=35570 RepID=A0A1I8Q6D3_STOCA